MCVCVGAYMSVHVLIFFLFGFVFFNDTFQISCLILFNVATYVGKYLCVHKSWCFVDG